MPKNILKRIIEGKDLEELIQECINEIYFKGPINPTTIEIISSIKQHHPNLFSNYENQIILNMGLFYKNVEVHTFQSTILDIYKDMIYSKFQKHFNPVQAELIEQSNLNKIFSFSTGTSVGKSFVFKELINNASHDVMIVVPSRALINEYMIGLNNEISIDINLLPFVDIVNSEKSKKSIFVVTPERAKEVFKFKDQVNLELVLFDEAQLAEEKNVRGLNFDSIVRRLVKNFPNTKLLFAHPFIQNPNAQIERNNLNMKDSLSKSYKHKTVGQIYMSYIEDRFYQFGLNKEVMGKNKHLLDFDPVKRILELPKGSILIYTSKSKIIKGEYVSLIRKYRNHFKRRTDESALKIIDKLDRLLGVDKYNKSDLTKFMRYGIVIHHGSLPLEVRKEIEKFVKMGFSRVCIATSTLYQGINMPFDLVWIDRLEKSKALGVKNLIGRGGRSTTKPIFDFGIVLIKDNKMSDFRKLMLDDGFLSTQSYIDNDMGDVEIDVSEFKEAIKNDDFSIKYNLTNKEVTRLNNSILDFKISFLLEKLIDDDKIISHNEYKKYFIEIKKSITDNFIYFYTIHLKREQSDGEKDVLLTAIIIMLWKMFGRTFSEICSIRYANVTKRGEVTQLKKELENSSGYIQEQLQVKLNGLKAKYMVGYKDLPNLNLMQYPKFKNKTVHDISYDDIVYDTFDYLDKLLNLKLVDIFYAAVHSYYIRTNDNRALVLSNYIKFGTNNKKVIWLVRYGYEHDEIEWLINHVEDVNEKRIEFKDTIYTLDEEKLERVKRHI